MKCEKCGNEMRYIQAGVSKKTGKPYNAFWAPCSNCSWKPQNALEATNVARQQDYYQNTPNNAPQASQSQIKPNWDKIAEGKVRHGVTIAYIEQGKALNEVTVRDINDWTRFIITGELNNAPPKQEVTTPVDNIDVSGIPF